MISNAVTAHRALTVYARTSMFSTIFWSVGIQDLRCSFSEKLSLPGKRISCSAAACSSLALLELPTARGGSGSGGDGAEQPAGHADGAASVQAAPPVSSSRPGTAVAVAVGGILSYE